MLLIPDVYILACNASSHSPTTLRVCFPFLQRLQVRGPKPPASSAEPVHAPGKLDPTTLPKTGPNRATNCTHDAERGRAALLAALSFLLTTNPSDPISGEVLGMVGLTPMATVQTFLTCLHVGYFKDSRFFAGFYLSCEPLSRRLNLPGPSFDQPLRVFLRLLQPLRLLF